MNALAAALIERQGALEGKLNTLDALIKKAKRGAMGLTLESEKTPEWREARKAYSMYWAALRNVNMQLNKLRTCVGYENVNGRRSPIYKYND